MTNSSIESAFAREYIKMLQEVLEKLPFDKIAQAMTVLKEAQTQKRHVFMAGNGGSAATASHMANDLMKTVAQKGKEGLKAIALSDNVQIVTAIANDESYNEIFAGQLKVLAHAKDVLIIISGSGNSPNIIRVLEEAKKMQLTTIGFLGKDGGKAKQMVDISLVVPSNDYGPIEDIHVIFNHLITAYLRNQ